MKPAPRPSPVVPEPAGPGAGAVWWAAGLIAAAVGLAYGNTFRVPFVFDDLDSVGANASLRHLGTARFPPVGSGATVSGRPMLNLSLAFNYAWTGLAPWSYHAVNLAIHLAAALVLFGLLRRTCARPGLRAALGGRTPEAVALAGALLWAVHPLLTESVTYVAQRAESLMGLCLLLTLYGVARAAESPRPRRWAGLAAGACIIGMGTKEVMVVAPLLALLYDRTFFAGTLAEAWRRRRGLYLGLAAGWLVLAWALAGSAGRGGTAGLGTMVSPWHYLLTQARAVPLYLKLAVWPSPLVLDYGEAVVTRPGAVAPQLVLLAAGVAATLWALWRRPVWGFAGAWFFGILAPSSSIVPVVTQTLAEHRMYLPLVAPVGVLVVGLARPCGRWGGAILAGLALAGIGLTWARNRDYRSAEALWGETVRQVPGNARALGLYATALGEGGREAEGAEAMARAVALAPDDDRLHLARGQLLAKLGQTEAALAEYALAVRLGPRAFAARAGLGRLLLETGRTEEAVMELRAAVGLQPGSAEAHNNLANALVRAGRPNEALPEYEAALRFDPGAADVSVNLAAALLAAGRPEEAIRRCEQVLARRRDVAAAQFVLGRARLALGQDGAALGPLREAARLDPGSAAMQAAAGELLVRLGRPDEGIRFLDTAVRLAPAAAPPRFVLGTALLRAGRTAEAEAHLARLVALFPESAAAHNNHGIALAQLGRLPEARAEFLAALRADPDLPDARENLAGVEAVMSAGFGV